MIECFINWVSTVQKNLSLNRESIKTAMIFTMYWKTSTKNIPINNVIIYLMCAQYYSETENINEFCRKRQYHSYYKNK